MYKDVYKEKKRAKQMVPGCGVTCCSHCKGRINNEQQGIIFQTYYAMGDINSQWEYGTHHTIGKTPYARKENHYYFTIENQTVKVCQIKLHPKGFKTTLPGFQPFIS